MTPRYPLFFDSRLVLVGHIDAVGYGNMLWVTRPSTLTVKDLSDSLQYAGRYLPQRSREAIYKLIAAIMCCPEIGACYHYWQDGRWFFIPPGFVFDFYSVPRLLWFLYPPRNGVGEKAAAIHDFDSRFAQILGIRRREGDRRFRLIMELFELSFAHRKWLAVSGYSLVAPEGDGTPGRKERRAMAARGDSWEDYKDLVIRFNREPLYTHVQV